MAVHERAGLVVNQMEFLSIALLFFVFLGTMETHSFLRRTNSLARIIGQDHPLCAYI
jgi:hypothetical protein